MTTVATMNPAMKADYINPMIVAAKSVFEIMLSCTPIRTRLGTKDEPTPTYDLSAIIGVTGKATGTIVLSVSREAALEVLNRMLDIQVQEIDNQVRDAVGELTNMIAGQAKSKMAHLKLSIGIPNMVWGRDYHIDFPTDVTPISIHFDSEVGPFAIEVGFTSGRAG